MSHSRAGVLVLLVATGAGCVVDTIAPTVPEPPVVEERDPPPESEPPPWTPPSEEPPSKEPPEPFGADLVGVTFGPYQVLEDSRMPESLDWNGDGYDDLLWADYWWGIYDVDVQLGDREGPAEFWSVAGYQSGESASVGVLGDVDGDGKSDVFTWVTGGWGSNYCTPFSILTVHYGDGREDQLAMGGPNVAPARIGDVDGDGFADVFLWASVWFGGEEGWVAESPSVDVPVVEVVPLGDLDGDGTDDFFEPRVGAWFSLLERRVTAFDAPLLGEARAVRAVGGLRATREGRGCRPRSGSRPART